VVAALVSCLGLTGCDDAAAPVFDILIVGADGGDPTVGTDVDTVQVQVRQGAGVEPVTRTSPPDDMDLAVQLADVSTPVTLTVELTGPTTHLLGAPPPFLPLETGGLVRVPVGPAGQCMLLEGPHAALAAARAQAGVVRSGTFALAAGGVGSSGPSPRVEAWDLLHMLRSDDLPDLPDPAGPTSAAPLGAGGGVLVVPTDGSAVYYDLATPIDRVSPIALHVGAGAGSTVVALDDGGAAVLGGGPPPTPWRA
jgi:hypothetical protein